MFCYRFFLKFRKTKPFQIGKEPNGRLARRRARRDGRAVWAGEVAPASRRLSGGRPRPLLLLLLNVRSFQIADQALEGFLIGVVVLPVAEVGNEILANLAGGIFSGVGVEALPVAQDRPSTPGSATNFS